MAVQHGEKSRRLSPTISQITIEYMAQLDSLESSLRKLSDRNKLF